MWWHVRSEEPAIVCGDATLLQNALLNLGLNARDAMPGGGTLRFVVEARPSGQASSEAANDGVVSVRVEDTGCGMTKEVIDHIFEPFYTTKEEGNGMGLAAVYGTVEGHDGSISVTSEPGKGTTFSLMFPATRKGLASTEAVSAPVSTTRFRGVRMLLAEDEVPVATVTQEMLTRLGCEVVHCRDGAAALKMILTGPERFDIALLDHSMPQMTGAEVLQALRDRGLSLPVISTSGYTEASDVSSEYRPTAFLAKPFKLSSLITALGSALPDRWHFAVPD